MKTPPLTRLQRYLQTYTFTPPSQSEQPQSPVDKVLHCLFLHCIHNDAASSYLDRTFCSQQLAIDFIDKYRSYQNDIKVFLFSPISFQLFSYEVVSTQQRVFLALTEAEFSHDYEFVSDNEAFSSEDNPLCHTYEIIREHSPCKLYMDVEVGIRFEFEVVRVRIQSGDRLFGDSFAAAAICVVLFVLQIRNPRGSGAFRVYFQ